MIENLDCEKIPHIYDVTLAVHPHDGGPATLSSILFGRKTVAEVYIRKYETAKVPKGKSAECLMDIYTSKDALIDNYQLTKKFGGKNFPTFDPPLILPRRIYSLINTICLNFIIVPAVFGQIGALAFSGSFWQFALALTLVIFMYVGLGKFIGLTKISKASSYGKKSQ